MTSPHLAAQERPGDQVEDRIDQFATFQDRAGGLRSLVPGDAYASRLSQADRVFLLEAHQVEMLQVKVAALARKRQQSTQAVQSHARRVLQAKRASLRAVEKIARDDGLELDRGLTSEAARKAEGLGQVHESNFAPAFFAQMLELHERTLALYEQADSTTENDDLRSLVEDSLPTLRTQLADAEQFSTILGTVAAR